MKNEDLFFNPFRLISPKLDKEVSRLHEIYDSPPKGITILEEGLLIMMNKIMEMTKIIRKSIASYDPLGIEKCDQLAKEIHSEEGSLTTKLANESAKEPNDIHKTIILFPGRLDRVAHHLQAMANLCRAKCGDKISFSDIATSELDNLLKLFQISLNSFHDALVSQSISMLEKVVALDRQINQLTLDYSMSHEERLCTGVCPPGASPLYLDILDDIRLASGRLCEMSERLLRLTFSQN